MNPVRIDPDTLTGQPELKVFPAYGMTLLVIATIFTGYLLVPKDRELMRRMIVDGRPDRALDVMGVKNGSVSLLIDHLISTGNEDKGRELLNDLRLLMPAISDPESVYQDVCANKDKLPTGVMPYVQDLLALRSLQIGATKLAEKIYRDLATGGFRNYAQLRRAVATARFTSNPQLGKSFVSGYLARNQVTWDQLPEDLRKTLIVLNRELNQGDQAFDLLTNELERSRGRPELSRIMAELAQVSLEADRFEDAVPLIEGYVEMTEAGRLTWADLLKGWREPRKSDPDFTKYAKLLAAYLEWNGRSSEAFELYRKLSLLGDVPSLDRCVTIYPWCSRENELTELLELLYPVAGRPDLGLLYAKLRAQRSEFDVAEEVLRELIRTGQSNAKLWGELGQVLNQEGRFTEAIEAYEHAYQLDPAGQIGSKIAAAQLYVSLLRFDEGLKSYQSLPVEALDGEIGEAMLTLAQALNNGEAFEFAQLKILAKFRKTRAVDFLHVAAIWKSAGNLERAGIVLDQGLKAFPNSDVLRLAQIDQSIERRDLTGAFEKLSKANHFGDFRYTSRLMSLALDLGRAEDALHVIPLSDPAARDWQDRDRLLLAELYVKAGREQEALTIFQDVPIGESGQQRLLARRAFRNGEFEKAIDHQKHYLSLAESPDPSDWIFLGDLLKALGRTSESERTYAQLLNLLREGVVRSDPLAIDLPAESDPDL